jgi:hypothetical protein
MSHLQTYCRPYVAHVLHYCLLHAQRNAGILQLTYYIVYIYAHGDTGGAPVNAR